MFRTIAGRSQTATGMPHRPRSKVPAASCVVALLGLGGCATTDGPKPMTIAEEAELVEEIETLADRAGKLKDLAFPILASNVEACGKRVRPSIGASWITEADLGGWPNEHRAVAKRHFGVSRRPVLDHVVDGGPAADAGLRRWDTIVAVDGRHLRSGGGDQSDIAMIVESGADDGRMEITYERDSETASVIVIPVTACDVGVALAEDEQPNAFADGRNVYLTKGLYWAEPDVGLQVIVAHQLAHILEGHVRKEQTRQAVGAAADVGVTVAVNTLLVFGAIFLTLAGADVDLPEEPIDTGWFFAELAGRMFTHRDEREADELSLVMLERAGVPAEAVVDFWRELAAEPADLVAFGDRHPTNAERLGRLDAALARILDERESPKPSIPEPVNDFETLPIAIY